MINKYTNKQRGLLAVIMAMVMVFAGAAFVAAEVDGEVQYSDDGATATVANAAEFITALADGAVTKIIISEDMTLGVTTISKPVTIEGVNDVKVTLGDKFNIANTEGEVTVTKLNITGEDKIFVSSNANVIFKECVFVDLVEHAVTVDQTKDGNVTFDNVDFNGSTLTIGVTSVVPKVTVSNCDEVDISFVAYTDAIVKLGTDIIFEEMDIGNVKFAASEGNITFNLDGEIFTAENINERYAKEDRVGKTSPGFKLTITNGTLKDTGFGAYYSAQDEADKVKAYRNSYIYLGNNVTLAGTTNVSGTDGEYVVIEGTAALSAGAVLNAEASCSFGNGLVLNSSDKETSAEFEGIVGTNGISISDGSLIIDGSVAQVDVTSGIAKIVSNISDDVVINLSEGVTLVIADDVTIPEGAIVIVGADVSGVTIATPVGFDLTGKVKDNIGNPITGYEVVSNTQYSESFGMSNDLESDYTVKTSAFLEKDLTIPEGITLTIAGTLDLNGCNLIVKGTLVVEKRGAIIGNADAGTNGIILFQTGTIVNDGAIGKDSYVTVKDALTDAVGMVTMKNVAGLSFGLTKESVDKVVGYTLTVSGEAVKTGEGYYLDIEGAYITDLEVKDLAAKYADNGSLEDCFVHIDAVVLKNGSLIIGSKTDAVVDVVLRNGSTFTVDGAIINSFDVCSADGNEASEVDMWNGSVATINGNVDNVPFSAKADKYLTYDSDGMKNDVEKMADIDESTITLVGIKDVVIEVTSKTYTNDDKKSETEQMLNIYGTPSDVNKIVDDEMSITIGNDVYVPAGKELVLGEKR